MVSSKGTPIITDPTYGMVPTELLRQCPSGPIAAVATAIITIARGAYEFTGTNEEIERLSKTGRSTTCKALAWLDDAGWMTRVIDYNVSRSQRRIGFLWRRTKDGILRISPEDSEVHEAPDRERTPVTRRAPPCYEASATLLRGASHPSTRQPPGARREAPPHIKDPARDSDPEREFIKHHEGEGVDLSIEGGPEHVEPGAIGIADRCAGVIALAEAHGPSAPEVDRAVEEATEAIVGELGTLKPGMIRKRLVAAVSGSQADRARLLDAARFADRRIAFGMGRMAGPGFVQRFDGVELAWPVPPDSEAARVARSGPRPRPREGGSGLVAALFGGPAPPPSPPDPAPVPRPASPTGPRPRGQGLKNSPEKLREQFELLRAPRSPSVLNFGVAQQRPSDALRQETRPAAGRT